MRPGPGRPPSDNPRTEKIEIRLTKNESEKLTYVSVHTKQSRSQIVRNCIEALYEETRKTVEAEQK